MLSKVLFYAPIRRLMWLTRMGSESAAERRQAYLRKYAVSESSEILGSEGSRKIKNLKIKFELLNLDTSRISITSRTEY